MQYVLSLNIFFRFAFVSLSSLRKGGCRDIVVIFRPAVSGPVVPRPLVYIELVISFIVAFLLVLVSLAVLNWCVLEHLCVHWNHKAVFQNERYKMRRIFYVIMLEKVFYIFLVAKHKNKMNSFT